MRDCAPLLASPVPQFNIARPCSACPFRLESTVGRLGPHTAERISSTEDPFGCHQLTTDKNRPLTHPKARYCAGHLLHRLAREAAGEALPPHMQLGERLGVWSRDWLQPAPVFATAAELIAHHSQP
jgi:hypothetical protein